MMLRVWMGIGLDRRHGRWSPLGCCHSTSETRGRAEFREVTGEEQNNKGKVYLESFLTGAIWQMSFPMQDDNNA